LAAGLVTEAIYLVVTLRLPWWRYGWSLRSWRELLGDTWHAYGACLLGAGILVAAYLVGWYGLKRLVLHQPALGRKIVWVFAVTFAATLFWLMPITSDLFNYLRQSHLLTDLGVNPLLDVPVKARGAVEGASGFEDQLLRAYPTVYASNPSIYGPAWILVAAPGTAARNDAASGLLYLKGLAAAAFLASAWLVERILRRVRPGAALKGLYLFAWNPLVLLMAVGDGHNDMVMMAVVLLAIWFLMRESWVLAFGALALSAWVKYVGALLMPLFVLYLLVQPRAGRTWNPWPAWAKGTLAALAVSGLVYWPLGSVEWALGVLERLLKPENWSLSIDPQLVLAMQGLFATGLAGMRTTLPTLMLAVGLALFCAAYLFMTGRLLADLMRKGQGVAHHACLPCRPASGSDSESRMQRLLNVGFVVSLLVFLLGAVRSQPWHLIWPASLAGLSAQRWAWPVIVALSALLLAAQIWVEWGTPGLAISH
jgi:hypothetical protein